MAKLAIFLFTIAVAIAQINAANVICYFASWTVYRPGNGKFDVVNVDPTLCTHIYFSFVGVQEDGTLTVLDDWEATGLEGIEHLIGLKDEHPNLKVLVSMGGWNEGSSKYSTVAADPTRRAKLISTTLEFIHKWGFDGFDLDWEYPCQREGKEEDRENFVLLLAELKAALHAENLLLSAAVSGGVASVDISYDVPGVSEQLDIINVMAYDFHGAFETFVGHHAPLYASSLDVTDEQKTLNVATGIEYWIEKGADPAKIHLGTGTYGRSFTLADANNASLYAGIIGGGTAGPYTRQDGVLGYNEICELHSDWERIWDDEQKVPHKLSGNQWVGYEDEESLALKVEFAKSKNLGGIMVWSLDTDDFSGICGGTTYPLIRKINEVLNS